MEFTAARGGDPSQKDACLGPHAPMSLQGVLVATLDEVLLPERLERTSERRVRSPEDPSDLLDARRTIERLKR